MFSYKTTYFSKAYFCLFNLFGYNEAVFWFATYLHKLELKLWVDFFRDLIQALSEWVSCFAPWLMG